MPNRQIAAIVSSHPDEKFDYYTRLARETTGQEYRVVLASNIPLLEKEGMAVRSKKGAKPPCSAQTGAKRERDSAKP
jgi:hypothetical protein